MSAEGYKSAPLSDEMERRIRERINVLKLRDVRHLRSNCAQDAGIAALEWVLQEAEAIKLDSTAPRVRDYTCPECQHEHESKSECSKYLGEGRFCHCEAKVTA